LILPSDIFATSHIGVIKKNLFLSLKKTKGVGFNGYSKLRNAMILEFGIIRWLQTIFTFWFWTRSHGSAFQKSIQLIAGCVGEQYNRRKNGEGSGLA